MCVVSDVFVDGVGYIVEPDVDGLRGVPVGMPKRLVRVTLPGGQRRGGRSSRVVSYRLRVGGRDGFGSLEEMREALGRVS